MIGPQTSLASPRELPDSNPRVTPVPDGLIVEWTAPFPTISEGTEGRSEVDIPGFDKTNQPGAPRLPFSSVLVFLPRGANPSIEVVTAAETTQPLYSHLEIGQQPEGVERDADGQIIGGRLASPSFEVNGPREVVQLDRIGIMRGANLARLSFFPVRISGKDLQVTTHLEVKVIFGSQQLQSITSRNDSMLAVLASLVVNPEQLHTISTDLQRDSSIAAKQLAGNPTVAIEVSDTGITELSYSNLAGIGFPVDSVNPVKLHLTRDGTPVDYQWLGDGDAVFESNESLRFYADPRFSRWTSSDTYFLSTEITDGARMQSRVADTGSTAGVAQVERLFEENKIYTPECYCAPIPAGRDGDRWVWDRLQRPSPSSGTYQFQLKAVDKNQTAEISIWLIGFTSLSANPDHQIEVNLNGNGLGARQWDGKNAYQADFSFPGSYLNEGGNTLTITLPDVPGVSVNGLWLDAFSVRHTLSSSIVVGEEIGFTGPNHNHDYAVTMNSANGVKVFDVSNANKPVELTSFQVAGSQITFSNPDTNQPHDYWITTQAGVSSPQSIRMVSQLLLGPGYLGADYLIITPQQFIPALNDLITLHQSNGLEVAVEDVQAIYDSYGEGRPLPAAIKSYLEDAYFSWNTPPLYVLLVGDGTHDPRNYSPASSETIIPPFLADVDPWAGETAADNRYVTVDGSDNLPDMIIGRLPANNISELETMISKIIGYESGSSQLPWQGKAVFVADNDDSLSGNFASLSEILIDQYPNHPFAAQRLYYNLNENTPEEFRSELQRVWDAGNGLIMYTGHASIHQWAQEIFLHLNDVPSLNNGQKLPVVLEMTCFTSSFQVPGYPTLDEDLLRHPGGGAVAVWGPTGLGIATGHHWLAEGFMNTIYEDGISEIGQATVAGKLNLASVGSNLDLIDTFTLLGDPATNLDRSYQNYLPFSHN